MIEIHGTSTPNVLKVLMMMEELGLEYEMHRIDIYAEDQFTPDFQALNPNCKVPVIIDPDGPDGQPITIFESGAILFYFAEKFDRFLPAEPRARTVAMQWLMLQMASIGPMFGQSNHFRRSAPQGNDYGVSRYVTEVKRLYDVVNTRLGESEYLGGDDYGLADMAAWPWIAFYASQNGVQLSGLKHVQRWCEAIEARPATQRAMRDWPELIAYVTQRREVADPEKVDRLFGRGRWSRA